MFKESFHIIGKGKPVSLEEIRSFCNEWDREHKDVRRLENPVYPKGKKKCISTTKQSKT